MALVDTLSLRGALPETLPTIPVDSPGEVLRRRPDIAAAERRLAASTARIGVATAELFPRFTLSGLIGSVAGDTSDLFTGPAETRRVALGIDWTFLDHDRVKARIEAAGADSRAVQPSRWQWWMFIGLWWARRGKYPGYHGYFISKPLLRRKSRMCGRNLDVNSGLSCCDQLVSLLPPVRTW